MQNGTAKNNNNNNNRKSFAYFPFIHSTVTARMSIAIETIRMRFILRQ